MFLSPDRTAPNARSLWRRVDGALDFALLRDGEAPAPFEPPHPHRLPLRFPRRRRPGAVAPRKQECLCALE